MTDGAKDAEWLKRLILDNRDKLGRTYDANISYIPDMSEMSRMPVKYGASTNDWKEAHGHNPVWTEVNVADVRFMVVADNCYYFAGKDGYVWGVMAKRDMSPLSRKPDLSDLSTFAWFTAVPMAASDLYHLGDDVSNDTVNYGWYLARALSEKIWASRA